VDGLFVDIRPYLNKPQYRFLLNEEVEGTHSFYVFAVIDVSAKDAQYYEKIWIDRSAGMQVGRKQMFGTEGRLETDVRYQNYQFEGEIAFPQVVVISRPMEDYTVKMTFQTETFNEPVPNDAFSLPRPDGSELVQLTK